MGDSALDVLAREHRDLRDLFTRVWDPDGDRVVAWFEVVKQIATHVAVEHTFVYPEVKRLGSKTEHLAVDLKADYSKMERLLVLTERRKVNSPDMPGLVTDLLDTFEQHEARCSNQVIPLLQSELSGPELDELGTKMRGAENVILSHPHPHLLAFGPVYQWTTRLASRWDRVRDRTVRNR